MTSQRRNPLKSTFMIKKKTIQSYDPEQEKKKKLHKNAYIINQKIVLIYL